MPKKGKLPDAVVADLTAWVKMGAPWGKDDGPVASVAGQARFRPATAEARPLGLAADSRRRSRRP